MSILGQVKQDERKKKGYVDRVEWYYIYLPETGVEPLTVSLLMRRAFPGLFLVFDDKLVVRTEYVDLTNPHHPFIIGEITEGNLEDLSLYTAKKYASDLSGPTIVQIKRSTISRRALRVRWGFVRSYCRRLLRHPNSHRAKGRVDGSTSLCVSLG